MSQSAHKMLLPPRKRKHEEDVASGSATRNTSKPLIPAPATTSKGHNNPEPSNLLLAGYLANEFLTNGTLFGRTLESAKARPGPFIYSSYLPKPKRGTKLLQQAMGKLDLARAEAKIEKKMLKQAQGKPVDSARPEPKNERKLPTQGKPDSSQATPSTEPKMKKPVQQDAEAKSRNLERHYNEVAQLMKTNEIHIPSVVNPKQLYQWIKRC